MRVHLKFSVWYLPLLGIIIGFAYAYGLITGLIAPWRRIPNPPEKISNIIGSVGWQLYVETVSGNVYSTTYRFFPNFDYPHSLVWTKEEGEITIPEPLYEYRAYYTSPPTLFKVKQLYEQVIPASAESNWQVKFALSEGGNLWMWHYNMGGLAFLGFFIFPARGLLFGVVLALVIKLALSTRKLEQKT